jgi:hypothetical protein
MNMFSGFGAPQGSTSRTGSAGGSARNRQSERRRSDSMPPQDDLD